MLVRQRTQLKNRIHANLAKYGAKARGATDRFGARDRKILEEWLAEPPPDTRDAARSLLARLDHL